MAVGAAYLRCKSNFPSVAFLGEDAKTQFYWYFHHICRNLGTLLYLLL